MILASAESMIKNSIVILCIFPSLLLMPSFLRVKVYGLGDDMKIVDDCIKLRTSYTKRGKTNQLIVLIPFALNYRIKRFW